MKIFVESSIIFGIVSSLFLAGCAGPQLINHRMAAYRPSYEGRVVAATVAGDAQSATGGTVEAMAPVQPEEPIVKATSETNVTSDAEAKETPSETIKDSTLRRLDRGDRLMIYLRGIPQPVELKDVIDGLGEVNLPFIGAVKLSGKTTSEAESFIENRYIDGGIYRQINVIVVAEDEMYFVQGEVSKQGKFVISGPVTLLQAISEAGGYSPYARRKKIKVIRGSEVIFFNGKDIADGKKPDPAIQPNDIIEVLRKII